MNKIFTFTLLSFLLFACGEAENPAETKRFEQAAKLHGEWVNKKFVEEIKLKKSVFATRKLDLNMIYIGIDSNRINSKVGTFKVWDDSDGNYSTFMKYDYQKEAFVNDTKKSSEILPNGKTNYSLNVGKSGELEIDFKGKGKESFISNLNFNSLLCDLLFAGNYRNKATGEKVEISITAETKGLPFSTFQVAFDFSPAIQMDYIIGKTKVGEEAKYSYVIKGNELHLQEFKLVSDMTLLKVGGEIVLEKIN